MIVMLKDVQSKYCPHADMKCEGDGCMSWRWHDAKQLAQIHETQETANGRRRGFCGLAGIPEQLRNADI